MKIHVKLFGFFRYITWK